MRFSETLRKWSPAVFVDRICTKSYVIPKSKEGEMDIRIEKGESVWIPIFAIQRDPKYYPDPEKFDPERFSEENKHNIVPYTFLSFGAGPRNCIGKK